MGNQANPAIGYACKLVGVADAAIRGTVLRCATPDRLRRIIQDNLRSLTVMVEYNAAAGIKLFRISSDIIPFASHPAGLASWRDEFAAELAAVGDRIRATGLRVSMHPGQYTVLNSPDQEVADNAVLDLRYHADFLDSLAMGTDAKIILHIGVYGDKQAALARFADRYAALPDSVRRRLILENDEKCYAIDAVVQVAETVGAPVVMDVFHHRINPARRGGLEYWLKRAVATWSATDGRPKIHYSQQQPGAKAGTHSRTISMIGEDGDDFLALYGKAAKLGLDIMLEVKDKNLSAEKCLLCVAKPGKPLRPALTETWAKYKYAVLEHSQKRYRAVSALLKQTAPDPVAVFAEIDTALAQPAPAGSVLNAADHVWGYFKKAASEKELRRYLSYRDTAAAGGPTGAMKKFLFGLAEKYAQPYLIRSLYFFLDAL